MKNNCLHPEYRVIDNKKYKAVCPNCAGGIRGRKSTSIIFDEFTEQKIKEDND